MAAQRDREPPPASPASPGPARPAATADQPAVPPALLAVRAAVGGLMMGLANLVPGISGGTMLLASGVYPRFIQGIADLSTLRLRRDSLLVVAIVVACAGAAIALLAGPVKGLVVDHRWAMYSLFIGLTLGGVPVVWRLARPATPGLWIGAAAGFAGMAALAILQARGATGADAGGGFVFLLFAGTVGAAAMILPGISGGYLLLVLGAYVPILGAIAACKDAVAAGDLAATLGPGLQVVLPVGIGVLLGVLAVSNALGFLLRRHEKPTLGALLGLLIGAVAGLWPFQEGVPPALGSVFKGEIVTAASLATIPPEKYPTRYFDPAAGHLAGALALIVAGFAVTALVARLGRDRPAPDPAAPPRAPSAPAPRD